MKPCNQAAYENTPSRALVQGFSVLPVLEHHLWLAVVGTPCIRDSAPHTVVSLLFLSVLAPKALPFSEYSLSETPSQKPTCSEVSRGHQIEFGVSAFSNQSPWLSENLLLSLWEPGFLSTSRGPCTCLHRFQELGLYPGTSLDLETYRQRQREIRKKRMNSH